MNRRHFSTLLAGAAAWPLAARAQQSSDRPLIGFMSPLSSATAARYIATFRSTLRELGYVEGGNIAIEFRFADGSAERMRDFAAELVALRPAVLVTGSPAAVLAVRDATRTIPIVMNSSQDPVRLGLAASMARPGGNVTGFWSSDEGLIGKQCELLKEAVPGTSRIGALLNPDDPADTE